MFKPLPQMLLTSSSARYKSTYTALKLKVSGANDPICSLHLPFASSLLLGACYALPEEPLKTATLTKIKQSSFLPPTRHVCLSLSSSHRETPVKGLKYRLKINTSCGFTLHSDKLGIENLS